MSIVPFQIRPIVYQSSDKMSVIADNKIDVVISVWPWGKYLGDYSVSEKIKTLYLDIVAGKEEQYINGLY